MNLMKDYMSESSVGICKATCQRCDVNLTMIHLLSEVFEHNNSLSRPIILLKRMTSRVNSLGMLTKFAGILVLSTRDRLESYYPRFNVNVIG